jgi:hypothetical protein
MAKALQSLADFGAIAGAKLKHKDCREFSELHVEFVKLSGLAARFRNSSSVRLRSKRTADRHHSGIAASGESFKAIGNAFSWFQKSL